MKKPNGDDEDGDKTSAGVRPNGSASGADAALDADPGSAEIAGRIAGFLDELARIRWDQDSDPILEKFRLNSVRAAELLRADGLDLSRSFRLDLRRARRLINQLYEVIEADLPPLASSPQG